MVRRRLTGLTWIFDIGVGRKELPGWLPMAALYGSLCLGLVAAAVLDVPSAWALSLCGAVDLTVTWHYLLKRVRRLTRFGTLGPLIAGWWFELAALDLTLLMSCLCFIVTRGPLGRAQVPGAIAMVAVRHLYIAFLILASFAYTIGLLRQRRARGNALQLVSAAYWCNGLVLFFIFVIPNPMQAALPICGVVAVTALCAAALAFRRRSPVPMDDERGGPGNAALQ